MEADFVGNREHLDLRRRPGVVVADVVVDARRPPLLLPGVRPALEAHPHHLRDREHVLHGPHAEGRSEDGRPGEDGDVRREPRRAALVAGAPRRVRVHGMRTVHRRVPRERDGQAAESDADHHEHPGHAERPGGAIVRGQVDGLPDMFQTVHTDEGIWACTTCYACVYECPVMNEHVPKIIDMRRNLVLTQGKIPPESMDMLRNIETNYNPWGIGWDQRGRWAEGLGVRTLAEAIAANEPVDVLYWVGCAASFDDRNRKVAQAFARILRKAGVRFAILGAEEKCTGDPARRIGNEYLAQTMIRANVTTLNQYGVKRIVASCPHCFNAIKNEYPEFGGTYEVVHHSQFLQELIRDGRLTPTRDVLQFLTYHDPCYLGRYNDVYDEPRDVLHRIPGVRVVEMRECRDHGFCCGAGGARMWMDERTGEKVNHRRLSHIEETRANAVATACPYCLIMFDDATKTKNREDIRRFDIAELLERSLL